MRVRLASITHKHGINLYAGGSRAELMEKLARYCRDNDGNKLLDHSLPDEELFDAYFEAEHYGSNEWVEFDDSEEVLVDVTKLVNVLADTWEVDHVNGDMDRLHALSQSLTGPDYEGAARNAGWVTMPDSGNGCVWTRDQQACDVANGDDAPFVEDAEQACEFDHIEPLPRATRFYSISDELADCLAKDERIVRDFAGMTIWARVEG